MNLIQQNEEVVKVIDEYYSFLWKLTLRNMMRSFIPTKLVRLTHIQFQVLLTNYRRKQPLDVLQLRRKQLELLCTETEKSNPYYKILYSDPYHIHELSVYLERVFPTFNWTALENVTQVRVDLIPRVKLMNFLHVGMFILAVLGVFKIFESHPKPFDVTNIWTVAGLVGLAYTSIFLLLILLVFGKARRRLQRTTNILRYMAIRSRLHVPPKHGLGADDLPSMT